MTDNQEIIHHRTTLAQTFLNLRLDKDVRIIDVACGTGIVAEELRSHGYTNIDGLDPVEGYLQVAQSNHLYKKVFKSFIDERVPTPIEDDTYDVMICCAGFFQSLISPKAFPELIRITKKDGVLLWNIAEGYEHYGRDYAVYDKIVDDLLAQKKWRYLQPIQRLKNFVFTDSGAAYLSGYHSSGISTDGYLYAMSKC
ncbi:uncharacterized protein LOC131884043 isoform X3 [Tigriopus californicus]|uniref:uncharacterized protein LOC131884043 isoform X3 n=1 Tax=Tigriopus californicus TaxID=6832 RepID=UPI0027D9D3CE|nr:uncharacterized protein LOC131884043 isoform X3 [Tigriopus californicus]